MCVYMCECASVVYLLLLISSSFWVTQSTVQTQPYSEALQRSVGPANSPAVNLYLMLSANSKVTNSNTAKNKTFKLSSNTWKGVNDTRTLPPAAIYAQPYFMSQWVQTVFYLLFMGL